MDEVGTEPSSDADSDLFGLDWGDDPMVTINSVTERNDRTRGGKELPGGDFQVAERSWYHQALWAATVSSQDKRWKQYEHHLGNRGCAQAVDFRQSFAPRGHKLVLDMLSGPLLTLLIGPMLMWMSLLTLTDLGRGDRHGGDGTRVVRTADSNEN